LRCPGHRLTTSAKVNPPEGRNPGAGLRHSGKTPTRGGGNNTNEGRQMAGFLGRAVVVATAGCLLAGPAGAQSAGSGPSSSPFSGLFSGADPVRNSPVDLQFRVSSGDAALEKR